jgi:hypothetical protein
MPVRGWALHNYDGVDARYRQAHQPFSCVDPNMTVACKVQTG